MTGRDALLQEQQSVNSGFSSFQNWLSGFLAVFSLVVISIFLRRPGSPKTKPVPQPTARPAWRKKRGLETPVLTGATPALLAKRKHPLLMSDTEIIVGKAASVAGVEPLDFDRLSQRTQPLGVDSTGRAGVRESLRPE